MLEKEEPAFLFAFVGTIADGDDFDAGGGEALIAEAEFFGGAGRDVEHAVRDEGAAVVDADFDGLAVFEVRGEELGLEGTESVPVEKIRFRVWFLGFRAGSRPSCSVV